MDLIREGHDFLFTRNWFRLRNLPTFREYIHPAWAGRKITYLELGVFEGMSLVWMLQRVLTHPESRAVGIDPWLMTTKLGSADMEGVYERAVHNLTPWRVFMNGDSKFLLRCELVRASSAEALRRMVGRGFVGIKGHESVDLSMVDGNHNALAVLDDARLVWKLLKPGGWMLFDDVENDRPKQDHVKEGVEMFLQEDGHPVKLLWKHRYMECYEKI
jgi:hypothetical protein